MEHTRLFEPEGVENVAGCNFYFEGACLVVAVGFKGHAEFIPDYLSLEPIRRNSVVYTFFSRGENSSFLHTLRFLSMGPNSCGR